MRRQIFERLLGQGTLYLHFPDGGQERIGHGAPEGHVHLRERSVLNRILADPQMAFGEAYMEGDWWPGKGGLMALFRLYFANLNNFGGNSARDWTLHLVRRLREANSRLRSRKNVEHHYDLDSELFRRFLDEDMHYSCAYFEAPDMSLEAAQEAKCRHIARKLCLKPGDRVLDIGSGWGGMGLYLARRYNVDVTGLTLSQDQYDHANRRAERTGLAHQVRFLMEDYREHGGQDEQGRPGHARQAGYDAIVSVGMFEHVGRPQYQTFFDHVGRLLRPDGRCLIHSIGRNGPPCASARSWVERYIFPGGYVPSLSEIAPVVEKTGLVLSDLEVWRLHYAKTLECWNERFQANRGEFRRRLGERFCRMWEFYLIGCQADFLWGDLSVFHLQLAHRNDVIPVTRDYLYEATPAVSQEQRHAS